MRLRASGGFFFHLLLFLFLKPPLNGFFIFQHLNILMRLVDQSHYIYIQNVWVVCLFLPNIYIDHSQSSFHI